MKTIKIAVLEFDHAWEAIQHTDASGTGKAITLQGQALVVSEADADRLEAAGVEFAYLADHFLPDGSNRIMTILVN